MYEGIDTIVLFEELAYEDVLPLRWREVPGELSDVSRRGCTERNLKLLQACAALEEHVQLEKPDEHSPYHTDIVRLDIKINLLLDMVGQILVANHPRPPAMSVRFNALGAIWINKAAPLPVQDTHGVLEMYLRECVVDPLRMIGKVVGVTAEGRVKVEFEPPGKAVMELIEKLAFRRHRRQVAGVRNTKRNS